MKRRTPAGIVACGIGLLLVACGGSHPDQPGSCHSASPLAPSGCVTITVTAATPLVKVAQSFRFAAIARHDDGSVAPVSEWSTDNGHVATVEPASGRVSGGANGSAHIIAEHDGERLAIELRVVPDYRGTWAGDFQVTACHESGQFMGFCRDFPIGAMFAVSLTLAQPQATVDGTFSFAQVSASVHGAIDEAGVVQLNDAETRTAGASVRLAAAILDLTAREDLRGSFRTLWRRDDGAGEAGFNGHLRLVTRAAATPEPLSLRLVPARSARNAAAGPRGR